MIKAIEKRKAFTENEFFNTYKTVPVYNFTALCNENSKENISLTTYFLKSQTSNKKQIFCKNTWWVIHCMSVSIINRLFITHSKFSLILLKWTPPALLNLYFSNIVTDKLF